MLGSGTGLGPVDEGIKAPVCEAVTYPVELHQGLSESVTLQESFSL